MIVSPMSSFNRLTICKTHIFFSAKKKVFRRLCFVADCLCSIGGVEAMINILNVYRLWFEPERLIFGDSLKWFLGNKSLPEPEKFKRDYALFSFYGRWRHNQELSDEYAAAEGVVFSKAD